VELDPGEEGLDAAVDPRVVHPGAPVAPAHGPNEEGHYRGLIALGELFIDEQRAAAVTCAVLQSIQHIHRAEYTKEFSLIEPPLLCVCTVQ
jgi:hypothetical protein